MWSRCRWVSRMLIGASPRAGARPRVRIPVPPSSTSTVPSSSVIWTHGGVAAVARRLGTRGGDRSARAPDLELHAPGLSRRPEEDHRPVEAAGADDRQRADLDVVLGSRQRPDPVEGVRGLVGPQRACQRLVLDRDRLPVVVERTEGVDPVLRRHRAGLLEPAAEQGAGRVVEEDDVAGQVHEERRGRQARQQVAGEDELERPRRRERSRAHPTRPAAWPGERWAPSRPVAGAATAAGTASRGRGPRGRG